MSEAVKQNENIFDAGDRDAEAVKQNDYEAEMQNDHMQTRQLELDLMKELKGLRKSERVARQSELAAVQCRLHWHATRLRGRHSSDDQCDSQDEQEEQVVEHVESLSTVAASTARKKSKKSKKKR